jgi:phosphatidylglycerophosphate synthase
MRSFRLENARKSGDDRDVMDISAFFGRPLALRILPLLYSTRITPVHLTIGAFVSGTASAFLIALEDPLQRVIGAILLQSKNVLDTLDGHLARARCQPSRVGSLLDSDTDFLVNLFLFAAIGYRVTDGRFQPDWILLVVAAFFSSLLQCSYFVDHLRKSMRDPSDKSSGRSDEWLPPADPREGRVLLSVLEKFYVLAYRWQDRVMARLDGWCTAMPKRGHSISCAGDFRGRLNDDRIHASRSSVLGLGTHLFLISLAAVLDSYNLFLLLTIIGGNAYLLLLIFRRCRDARAATGGRSSP